MLVITLRTVTFTAPCRLTLLQTISSAVVPWAARRSSSQRSAGVSDRILLAQALNQLHGEGSRQRLSFPNSQEASGLGVSRPPASSIRSASASASRRALPLRTICSAHASQIFNQDDSERDRNRPQLADRQRLHALICVHESAKHVRIESAVGVRDESPRQAEHARIACERTLGELRQTAIIAARKIVADVRICSSTA